MKKSNKKEDWVRIVTKILSICIIVFGLPFYFGYGNPLPFVNPTYTFFDNMWLCIFPLMFIGLGVGLKNQKIGGWMTTISVGFGLLLTLALEYEIIWHMLIPLACGVSYLIKAYSISIKK